MTKFGTEDDPGFVSIVGELRRWVKELKPVLVAPEVTASASEGAQAAGEEASTHPTNTTSGATYKYNTGGVHAVFGNPTYHKAVQISM